LSSELPRKYQTHNIDNRLNINHTTRLSRSIYRTRRKTWFKKTNFQNLNQLNSDIRKQQSLQYYEEQIKRIIMMI